jgi:hypothetical protein
MGDQIVDQMQVSLAAGRPALSLAWIPAGANPAALFDDLSRARFRIALPGNIRFSHRYGPSRYKKANEFWQANKTGCLQCKFRTASISKFSGIDLARCI